MFAVGQKSTPLSVSKTLEMHAVYILSIISDYLCDSTLPLPPHPAANHQTCASGSSFSISSSYLGGSDWLCHTPVQFLQMRDWEKNSETKATQFLPQQLETCFRAWKWCPRISLNFPLSLVMRILCQLFHVASSLSLATQEGCVGRGGFRHLIASGKAIEMAFPRCLCGQHAFKTSQRYAHAVYPNSQFVLVSLQLGKSFSEIVSQLYVELCYHHFFFLFWHFLHTYLL